MRQSLLLLVLEGLDLLRDALQLTSSNNTTTTTGARVGNDGEISEDNKICISKHLECLPGVRETTSSL